MSIERKYTSFTQNEISLAFKNARTSFTRPGVHILISPGQKEFGRILIIASRKVGSAIARNKIKRQLKSIFYELKLFEKPLDCIVILKPTITQLDFQDLQKYIVQAYAQQT